MNMDENEKEAGRRRAAVCISNLKKHNFAADFFETKEEAVQWIRTQIPKGSSIGVGGSMTLFQIGLIDYFTNNSDYRFLDRYHTDDADKIFHESLSADFYLMSSNALTMDGCLYNVDGRGNRTAALIYGPEKVFVICGINKIVKDFDEAVKRVQTEAAPANNIRLKKNNPCTKTGMCMECTAPDSICNQFVYTRRSSVHERIHVIVINEILGY